MGRVKGIWINAGSMVCLLYTSLPTPFPCGIEEGMREFDRAAALGENREQTSSDRGSTPLASTKQGLQEKILEAPLFA